MHFFAITLLICLSLTLVLARPDGDAVLVTQDIQDNLFQAGVGNKRTKTLNLSNAQLLVGGSASALSPEAAKTTAVETGAVPGLLGTVVEILPLG